MPIAIAMISITTNAQTRSLVLLRVRRIEVFLTLDSISLGYRGSAFEFNSGSSELIDVSGESPGAICKRISGSQSTVAISAFYTCRPSGNGKNCGACTLWSTSRASAPRSDRELLAVGNPLRLSLPLCAQNSVEEGILVWVSMSISVLQGHSITDSGWPKDQIPSCSAEEERKGASD